MSNQQFDSLEMKLAFQEDIIQKLDDALVSQQQQILTLQRQVQLLGNELRALDTRSLGDATTERHHRIINALPRRQCHADAFSSLDPRPNFCLTGDIDESSDCE